MRYSTIIFDLDGVICHTDDYHFQAWKTIADNLNIYFDKDINNRLRGVSRMDSFDIILEKYDGNLTSDEKEKYTHEKNELYKRLLDNITTNDLSLEVKDTLLKLKNMGVKLAIGSSSKNAKLILGKLDILDLFDAISDGNNIAISKPDPEVFIKACEYVADLPQNCLVIEDAHAGIIAGNNAMMTTAGIGDAKECELCDYKLNTFSDILSIFE